MAPQKILQANSTNGSISTTESSELEPSIVTNTPKYAKMKEPKCFPPLRSIPPHQSPSPPSPKIFQPKRFKKLQQSTSTQMSSKSQTQTLIPSQHKTPQYPKFSFSHKNKKALPWSTKDSVSPSRKNSISASSEKQILSSSINIKSNNFPQSSSSKLAIPNPSDTTKKISPSNKSSNSSISTQKFSYQEEAVPLTPVPPNNGWPKYVQIHLFSPWNAP